MTTPDERAALMRRGSRLKPPHGPDHGCRVCALVNGALIDDAADFFARLRREQFVVIYGEGER